MKNDLNYHRVDLRSTRKRKWPKILGGFVLLLILALVALVIWFTPLNNGLRSATNQDTPADKVVKKELVKRLQAQKTGEASVDRAIDKGTASLQKTRMATLMSAASNQKKAAKLIQKTTGSASNQASQTANAIFANASLTKARKAIATGNWYQAYQAYETLSDEDKRQLLQLYQAQQAK